VRDIYITQIRLRRMRTARRARVTRLKPLKATPWSLRTARAETEVCVCLCVCTRTCVSQLVMCLSRFSERLSRAGTRRTSLMKLYGGGTAGHRHRCLGERADCRETAEREQTIYALLYRGRAALTPLGPIPLEALEERGPRVCAALLAAHRARRLARAGGDALGVARHHRVELLGGARE
jgi:hypothetical protein